MSENEERCSQGPFLSTITDHKDDVSISFFLFWKQDVDSCISEILKAGSPFGLKSHFLMPHGIFMHR